MSYEAVVEAIAKEFYTAHRIPGHSRKVLYDKTQRMCDW